MLSYAQAERQMASLLRAADLFYDEEIGAKSGEEFKQAEEDKPEAVRHYKSLIEQAHEYGAELASYPHFIEILEGWMVKIYGRGEKNALDQQTLDNLDDLDMNEAFRQQGALAVAVQLFLFDNGFKIVNRGIGDGNWFLGTICTTSDMRKLTALLHAKYAKAVEAASLRITVKFWHWQLPTLRTMDDVKAWFGDPK